MTAQRDVLSLMGCLPTLDLSTTSQVSSVNAMSMLEMPLMYHGEYSGQIHNAGEAIQPQELKINTSIYTIYNCLICLTIC